MEFIRQNNSTEVVDFGDINLSLTLDCGQAFRWEEIKEGIFRGIAYNKEVKVSKTPDGLLFIDTPEEDVKNIWVNYFDLNKNYGGILENLSADPFIKASYARYGTVRILNQQPWETLCSFIISSCNNIPRIKGIIKKLCEAFGEKTGEGCGFPNEKTLATKTEEDLAFLRAGYRVPYILDAAKKTAEGEIDFDSIRNMTQEDARNELMKIKGVGRKVADCTLLFSLGFSDVYPVDRHIERATKEYYPDGIPKYFHPNSGLAQQYIFSRMIGK